MSEVETITPANPSNGKPVAEGGDLSEFLFVLSSRNKVPADRIAEIVNWTDEQLIREASQVTDIHNRFAMALSKAADDQEAACAFLQQLDMNLIETDHNWRSIFRTIRIQKVWRTEHKTAAMSCYMDYLSFRKNLVAYIMNRKASLSKTNRWLQSALLPRYQVDNDGFVQLQKGQPVALQIPTGSTIELLLASRKFQLVTTQPARLIDERGNHYSFLPGKNIVGRHVSADIKLPEEFDDISRAHVIIQFYRGKHARFTDLSSGGTYISKESMKFMSDEESTNELTPAPA